MADPDEGEEEGAEIVALMKELDIPITRENFIEFNWNGKPPVPWDGEAEAQLPEALQDWSRLENENE